MKRTKNESQCFGGIAEKHEILVSGINTLVRLPRPVFCAAMRGESHAQALRRKGDGHEFGIRSAECGMGNGEWGWFTLMSANRRWDQEGTEGAEDTEDCARI